MSKATYQGSCVDIGNNSNMEDYFDDASALACALENNSRNMTKDQFLVMVNVPKNIKIADTWEYGYFYDACDVHLTEMAELKSGLFYAYNPKTDIHYFFSR